jgi:hypothetical protein
LDDRWRLSRDPVARPLAPSADEPDTSGPDEDVGGSVEQLRGRTPDDPAIEPNVVRAGGVVAIIVFTGLKLKDRTLFEEFFANAESVAEQASRSPGNFGSDFLADADQVYWTVTAQESRKALDTFVTAEPHRCVMARIDEWCEEASVVDWNQENAELPSRQEGYWRLIATGRQTRLSDPTDALATPTFPAPIRTP